MPKPAAPSSVYVAWERIVFGPRGKGGALPPEAEAEWAALWQEQIVADSLSRTPVDDAALLCKLGWELAVQSGDWAAALLRARRCTEHPNWEQADGITRQQFLADIALAQLYLGDLAAAVRDFRSLLALRRSYRPLPLYLARGHLFGFCSEHPAMALAPEEIARLAADVARRFQGSARLADGIVPREATYGQLAKALDARPNRHASG